MCARKVILDSDEEDEEMMQETSNRLGTTAYPSETTASLTSGSYNEQNTFHKYTIAATPIASGLLSPTEYQSSMTLLDEPVLHSSHSPHMSKVKRNKTTIGELRASDQKIKKLYGTKTTLDDLRLREGRRNELWEQAVDSDLTRGDDTRKPKRKKPDVEVETRSFGEVVSAANHSQPSSGTGRTLEMEVDQLESALESHYKERKDEIPLEGPKPNECSIGTDAEVDKNINDVSLLQHQSVYDGPHPIGSPEVPTEISVSKNSPSDISSVHTIEVSIPKQDLHVDETTIIAPSISQLADQPEQQPTKPTRKRKQSPMSSQADELASEDIIGLPKEQYKPRPSRSRRQNDYVDELVKGIDYSKTVESVVRTAKKGKTSKSKAKRRQTTGCLLGSTKDWDEDEDDKESKDLEKTQLIDEDDVLSKSAHRSKTAAAETANPKLIFDTNSGNGDTGRRRNTPSPINGHESTATEPQDPQDVAEDDDDFVLKHTKKRKQTAAQIAKSITSDNVIDYDEEDDLHVEATPKPRKRRKSAFMENAEMVAPTVEVQDDANEDDFHPFEELPDPLTSEPKSKKKRGRPKKQEAEPNPETPNVPAPIQPFTEPSSKPASKRRKTKELPQTQPISPPSPNTSHTLPPPPTQPLADSPAKANAALPAKMIGKGSNRNLAEDELGEDIVDTPPTRLETPQRSTKSVQRMADEKEVPSPSKKQHSPLSSSKVPLRVGLSRRQRIEPLLRVRR